jgi:CelD/BcsL family acetyltransferase involved in cellulose biosynthesis
MLRRWAQQSGLSFRQQEKRTCPFLALPESFDAYLAGLSDSMRYHIRRRTRDILIRQGGRLEIVTEPSKFDDELETLIRLHLVRWHSQGSRGTLGKPGFSSFLHSVCTSRSVAARLYLLRHENQTVAALLSFHFGQSALYYQAGWDPGSAMMRFSPGVVVMAQSVQDAIQQGLKYYEFLRGEESYKLRWTKTYRETVTVLIARTPLARGYLSLLQFADLTKRFLR